MRKTMLCLTFAAGMMASLYGEVTVQAQTTAPKDERITMNLPSIPLGTFLKLISQKTGKKLVTTADVANKSISLYLPEVTGEEALDAMCNAYELYIEQQAGTDIYVVKENDAAFFPLEHTNAKDFQAIAPALVGSKGRVTYDEKNNLVAVQGSRVGIEKIKQLVAQVDHTPRQVLIEAAIAELTQNGERQLGIRWEPSVSARGASRETKAPFSWDYVSTAEDAKAWTFGFLSFTDFFVQLQAIENEGQGRILANPRITTLDRRDAMIEISSNIVVAQKVTQQSQDLTLTTTEPIYAKVGVTLKTTPRVHSDGKVTLVVEPSVITAAKSQFFEQAVDTFTRSAIATVILEDGQTIALGGLLRDDESLITRRVPYLSDVPVIGPYLFTHKDKLVQKTDLVVFLTPHVLDNEAIEDEVRRWEDRPKPQGLGRNSPKREDFFGGCPLTDEKPSK